MTRRDVWGKGDVREHAWNDVRRAHVRNFFNIRNRRRNGKSHIRNGKVELFLSRIVAHLDERPGFED